MNALHFTFMIICTFGDQCNHSVAIKKVVAHCNEHINELRNISFIQKKFKEYTSYKTSKDIDERKKIFKILGVYKQLLDNFAELSLTYNDKCALRWSLIKFFSTNLTALLSLDYSIFLSAKKDHDPLFKSIVTLKTFQKKFGWLTWQPSTRSTLTSLKAQNIFHQKLCSKLHFRWKPISL